MMTEINVPRLRFKGFDGEWTEERLGSIVDYEQPSKYIVKSTEYSDDYKVPVLTAGKNFLLGYTNEKNVKKSSEENPIIIFDDFTTGSHYVTFDFMVKSSAMKLLKANNDNDTYFIYCILKGINYVPTSHSRQWISNYAKFNVKKTNRYEQNKISTFFRNIDKIIELQTKKLNQLKKLKRGYLQKMFPQKGESVPRLRFGGFSGEWKQEKLAKLVNISTGFPFKSADFDVNGKYTVITNKSIHANKKFVLNNGDKIDSSKGYNKYILEKGDILITMDGNVGISAVVNDQHMILAQRVARISHNDKLSDYIFAFLNSNNFISGINKISIGSIIKHISLNDIKEFKCFIPDEEEIIKIGNFFNKIDSLIVSESDYLEILKQQKKAYLQKMFI